MIDDVVCRIVGGDLETPLVYRDERLIAFLDHHPVFKGHVLIAPVAHVATLLDLPADLAQPLLALTQRISRAQMTTLGAQGTFTAVNTVVSQSVPHLHVHVVPRTKGDGLRGFFWPRTRYAAGEADDYARRISAALDGDSGAQR